MQRPAGAGKTAARATAILMIAGLALAGCAGMQEHDRTGKLTKEDYRDLLPENSGKAQAEKAGEKAPEPPQIPGMVPDLAQPEAPRGVRDRRVTVNLNQKTPVKEVLLELASKVNVDLEMAPAVDGRVIMSATERRLEDVVRRLTRMADLRYEFKDGVLRIWPDRPYMKTYEVDYLNMTREASGSMSTSTDVFSAGVGGDGGGGGGGNNGSQTSIKTSAKNAFWKELKQGLNHILTSVRGTGTPQKALADMQQAQGGAGGDGDGADGGDGDGASGGGAKAGRFSIHQQAGVISVFATEEAHKAVADWLTRLRRNVSPQVLIEAKVVEVELNDEYEGGINWQALEDNVGGIADVSLGGTALDSFSNMNNTIQAGADTVQLQVTEDDATPDLDAIMNFVKGFGTTRTLSSPRLTVTNNQSSVIKVAKNYVYFTIDIQTETDDQGNVTNRTYESEIHTVPIGFLMSVRPSIDRKDGEVQIHIRPTLSRVVDTKQDPAVRLQAGDQNVTSAIPVVDVREMESVLRLNSGEVAILGGLMQERAQAEDVGLPGVKEVPVAGTLFKRKQDATNVVELVVFLKARILDEGTGVTRADEKLYKNYTRDPRPLDF